MTFCSHFSSCSNLLFLYLCFVCRDPTRNDLFSPTQTNHSQSESGGVGRLLLPLPLRDDNPEMAAAEMRLWNKIDAAVEEYTNEILNIRRAQERSGPD